MVGGFVAEGKIPQGNQTIENHKTQHITDNLIYSIEEEFKRQANLSSGRK
jgi:hypothetical protein